MKVLSIIALALVLAAECSSASEIRLTSGSDTAVSADNPRDDLRPGFKFSCRVKFDRSPAEAGEMTIVRKGFSNNLGCYILRVDGPNEGCKFSFFANVDGSTEPRVSVMTGKPIVAGKWYEIFAGWDGTNQTLCVNGEKASCRRVASGKLPGCLGGRQYGPLLGTLDNPKLEIPAAQPSDDCVIRPGFRIACDAEFLFPPKGEMTVVSKWQEYLLRYEKREEKTGVFSFFVYVGGGWDPHTTVRMDVVTGQVYSISAGWDGRKSCLSVDSLNSKNTLRSGLSKATDNPLKLGTPGQVRIKNFMISNPPRMLISLGYFRTEELMPIQGKPATIKGMFRNTGEPLDSCIIRAHGRDGVMVTPETVELKAIESSSKRELAWRIEPGDNGLAYVDFEVVQNGKTALRRSKRIVFMPENDPPEASRNWNPPVRPVKTWYVDSDCGDDKNDGLTPETAWRTFANITGRSLGPGERLLLRRGSVFNEELCLSASGTPENWTEIGAYGNGMRPQIRRNRHINEKCGLVTGAAYLVVRDIIFCNAGSGFSIECSRRDDGHILIERCLAHHIEGRYRFNSHGIPEWRDDPEPIGPVRSRGISVCGTYARHYVMRDCESYQCSNGFGADGVDSFVTRMFCHDNFAHNTSPHPYNLASRSWMTDCVFDASGWHASAGTMGVMLANNDGFIIRGCHFLNQPDSGSPDQGGIDFEAGGENCRIDRCTFRNNAGAAIEVLGLRSPQTRNVHIRRCRFEHNNWAYKNGPAEIQVWGYPETPEDVACSNGLIEDNGYVLTPGVRFYVNNARTTNDWRLVRNREFDFAADLSREFNYVEVPDIAVCGEIWTDRADAGLEARCAASPVEISWEQVEGQNGIVFCSPTSLCTRAVFPGRGDWRVNVKADNGTLWRTARTAVHVLPAGACTFHAWDFARNLDPHGWRVENSNADYENLVDMKSLWKSKSHPVRLVCGDYYVIAVKNSGKACMVTPDERDVGVAFRADRVNTMRVRMQNHTDSIRMRLYWQTPDSPRWTDANSVAFEVKSMDSDDTVYSVPVPPAGDIKQLKLAFSADSRPVTGTVRIDYIWLGCMHSN